MRKNRTYSFKLVITAAVLCMVLSWLTVSLPYVYEARKAMTEHLKADDSRQNDNTNPFTGSTEEKAPSTVSISIAEEYLHHEDPHFGLPPMQISKAYIHAHESTYIAYHGELLCPPPNVM